MARPKSHTKDQLIQLYLAAESKYAQPIKSTELKKYGLPEVTHFNIAFRSWNRFLRAAGKDVQPMKHRKKDNPNRFLSMEEYNLYMDSLKNDRHKMQIQLICMAGLKIEEARRLTMDDINFGEETVDTNMTVSNSKGSRIVPMSAKLSKLIQAFRLKYNLTSPNDTFDYPSQYGFNKRLKYQLRKIGMDGYQDFSSLSLLKTFEVNGNELNT